MSCILSFGKRISSPFGTAGLRVWFFGLVLWVVHTKWTWTRMRNWLRLENSFCTHFQTKLFTLPDFDSKLLLILWEGYNGCQWPLGANFSEWRLNGKLVISFYSYIAFSFAWCKCILRPIYTEWKQRRRRNISLMFVVYVDLFCFFSDFCSVWIGPCKIVS